MPHDGRPGLTRDESFVTTDERHFSSDEQHFTRGEVLSRATAPIVTFDKCRCAPDERLAI
jgi:hypothetical protein